MKDYKQEFDRLFFDRLKIPFNEFCKRCAVPVKAPISPYVGSAYWQANPKVLFVGPSHFASELNSSYMANDLDEPTASFIKGSMDNIFGAQTMSKIAYCSLIPCMFPSKSMKESILGNCINGLNTLYYIINMLKPDTVIFLISRYQYDALHDLSPLLKPGTSVEEVTKIDSEIEQDGISAPYWLRTIQADYGRVRILVLNRNVSYDRFYPRIIEKSLLPKSNNEKTVIGAILSNIRKH